MARPRKNNADYFSHESEMRNDVKIKALRRKFSHTGYAVWNYLLEVLTDAEGFSIKWEELDIELYAADFDLDVSELTEIVDYCLRLGLLQKSGSYLLCNNLTSSFEALMNKRGRPVTPLNPVVSDAETTKKESFGSKNPLNPVVSDAETDIVEKSRVKKSKVYSSPRTREGASAPGEEEKEVIYRIFFWRNMKKPGAEVIRFWEHNAQYGWKFNDTPEKRIKAAEEWVPESKGNRVSKEFLELWKAIYAKIPSNEDALKDLMLEEDTRASVNNGALVIHAHPKLVPFLYPSNHPELAIFARGNPIRFSSP